MKRMLFSLVMLIGAQELCAQQQYQLSGYMPSQSFSRASGWLWSKWNSTSSEQRALIGAGLIGTTLVFAFRNQIKNIYGYFWTQDKQQLRQSKEESKEKIRKIGEVVVESLFAGAGVVLKTTKGEDESYSWCFTPMYELPHLFVSMWIGKKGNEKANPGVLLQTSLRQDDSLADYNKAFGKYWNEYVEPSSTITVKSE